MRACPSSSLSTRVAAAVCGLALTAAAAPPPGVGDFEWRQPIRGPAAARTLFRLEVEPGLYDGARAFPSDVRVLDESAAAWPFFVWSAPRGDALKGWPVELLNTSVAEGRDRYLRVDARVRDRGGGDLRHDRIVVRTAGSDYIRRVEVLGSEDGSSWHKLGAGYLVKHPQAEQAGNRTVTYPPSTFPHLQVRIFPDARDATAEVSLQSLDVMLKTPVPAPSARLEASFAEEKDGKAPAGVQTIVADGGCRNVPAERLLLSAGGGDFVRPVRVHGRNDPTNTWRWVGDGAVYRIGAQVSESVPLRGASHRFYRIEILNGDDPPLRVRGVALERQPHYLVVEAGQGGSPRLYFGSAAAEAPRYDLRQRVGDKAVAAAPLRDLGRREPNPAYAAHRPPRFGKWLSAAAVGAASALVIAVVLNMARRRSGVEGGHRAG
jgi:hypothetical protein